MFVRTEIFGNVRDLQRLARCKAHCQDGNVLESYSMHVGWYL